MITYRARQPRAPHNHYHQEDGIIGYPMRFIMKPDIVYQYPICAVGVLLVSPPSFALWCLNSARASCSRRARRRHNDVAAAILSIIGITYAVLLAFVAMLASNVRPGESGQLEQAALVEDVYNLSAGFDAPVKSAIRNNILGYVRVL